MGTMNQKGVLIAVDGGGSKTDAVAIAPDGRLLAHATGATSNPQLIGVEPAVGVVDAVVTEVLAAAGGPLLRTGVYLAGLDLPVEIATFADAIAHLPWGTRDVVIDNDMFALLRAGTEEPNAVAVVCGTGNNCVGVRADGKHARFPALGPISGDWGGGSQLGEQALWHAARAVDGRGGPTVFTELIPASLGLPDLQSVIEALHFGRLPGSSLATLAPLVLAAADEGDPIAISIVDRQAEEIVASAVAAIARLDLAGTPLPVVLGGGVLASGNAGLLAGVASRLAARAPLARIELVTSRPILGAALLTLEAAGADRSALETAREALAAAVLAG